MSALELEGPVLIVAGKSAFAPSETWAQALPDAGFPFQVVPFAGECSVAEIERVEEETRLRQAKSRRPTDILRNDWTIATLATPGHKDHRLGNGP